MAHIVALVVFPLSVEALAATMPVVSARTAPWHPFFSALSHKEIVRPLDEAQRGGLVHTNEGVDVFPRHVESFLPEHFLQEIPVVPLHLR